MIYEIFLPLLNFCWDCIWRFMIDMISFFLIDEHLADYGISLVELIFETLYLYSDRPSQAAVEFVIVKSLKESTFVKAFTGMLVQTADKCVKAGTISVYYKLLRWSCLLLRWNTDILTAKTAFAKLSVVQGSLLFSLLQGPYRVKRATKHIFWYTLSQV